MDNTGIQDGEGNLLSQAQLENVWDQYLERVHMNRTEGQLPRVVVEIDLRPDHAARGRQRKGLSDDELKKIPTIQITKQLVEERSSCTVCLQDYKEGASVNKLPCDHLYHTKCILNWLKRNTCPNCRADVRS